MSYMNFMTPYGVVTCRNIGEEIDELNEYQNIQELILTSPRLDFAVINKMHSENFKIYKNFIRTQYEEWWKQVKINKERHPEIKKLYKKFCNIFEENDVVLSQVSMKFDNDFLQTGFLKGELYTISAPSGIGKTALSIMLTAVLASGFNQYKNLVFEPHKVVYVSLEQNKKQIQARIKSTLLGLNDLKNSCAYLELYLNNANHKISELADSLSQMCIENIEILSNEDFYSLHIDEILNVIKKSLNGVDVLIIDQYENIENSLNTVSDDVAKKLKAFAQEENVVMILQSQLNKTSVEKAKVKNGLYDAQKLSGNSLRGTSGLEHQSTSILFIVPLDQEKMIDGHKAKLVEIFIAKNRYGESGKSIKMWHIGALNIFLDIDFEDNGGLQNVDI
ncbi:MAG: DnaB-like helicase C-terminal domain-containing protein [Massilimicrobiota sp.]|nr:DnaB-like helicase C-terminal domain-containing protein [Massilimicrobiota sp.]